VAREDIEDEIKKAEETAAKLYQKWTEARIIVNNLRTICPIDPDEIPRFPIIESEMTEKEINDTFDSIKTKHVELKKEVDKLG